MADKTIQVTLVKSPIGAIPKHRKTVEAMDIVNIRDLADMPFSPPLPRLRRQSRTPEALG